MPRPLFENPTDPESVRMTLGEHLEELRTRLLRSLIALVLACIVCIWFAKWLLVHVVARPVILALERHGQPTDLLATSPVETLIIYIKTVLFCGLVLASPYLLYQAWGFVAAGLYPNEKRWVYRLVPVSAALFLVGVVFMYTLVLLVSLNFLIGFSSWFPLPDAQPTGIERLLLHEPSRAPPLTTQPTSFPAPLPVLESDPPDAAPGLVWLDARTRTLKIQGLDGVYVLPLHKADQRSLITTHFKIGEYLTFVLIMTIAFGLAFQVPLVVVFLVGVGIVSATTLASYRKVAILGIVIIAGMIAPPDLMSHILLSGPMIVLFEIGLWWARRTERKQQASGSRPAP